MSKRLQRKARGERPYFFDDPSVDKLVAMIMGLAGETAVMRDRLDTIERLLETKGLLKRGEIESYQPGPAVIEQRAAWRENYLSEILRIVESELEGAASGDTAPYEEAINAVQTDRKPAAKKKPARRRKSAAKK